MERRFQCRHLASSRLDNEVDVDEQSIAQPAAICTRLQQLRTDAWKHPFSNLLLIRIPSQRLYETCWWP